MNASNGAINPDKNGAKMLSLYNHTDSDVAAINAIKIKIMLFTY